MAGLDGFCRVRCNPCGTMVNTGNRKTQTTGTLSTHQSGKTWRKLRAGSKPIPHISRRLPLRKRTGCFQFAKSSSRRARPLIRGHVSYYYMIFHLIPCLRTCLCILGPVAMLAVPAPTLRDLCASKCGPRCVRQRQSSAKGGTLPPPGFRGPHYFRGRCRKTYFCLPLGDTNQFESTWRDGSD